MALGDTYATLAEFKAYAHEDADNRYDDEILDALRSSSIEIENWCERQFNDAGTPSARVFYSDGDGIDVNDFSTTTGLAVAYDTAGDGSYSQTVDATAYTPEPLNGVLNGVPGWPYRRLAFVGYRPRWTAWYSRPDVQVTARWGWTTVPAPVKQACLILALETFKMREAPFGAAGISDLGIVRVRDNQAVARKLAPYRKSPVKVV